MKIAVIVTGGLHPSGREQVVPSWIELFSALATEHEIHAFVLRHLAEAQSYMLRGFHVHDLGRPAAPLGLTRKAQERALLQAMDRHGRFDVVHGIWGDPAGQLAVRAGRRLGVSSIATCDSGEFESLPSISYGSQRTARGRAAIAEALAADAVHVCSAFMAAKAAAHGVIATVIPLTTVHAAHRHRPLTPNAPLRLIQVASLSRVKNQRLLIDAIARIGSSVVSRVDLVGEDTLGGELQRHAAEMNVSDRVRFHGFTPHDELTALYKGADIYVQTSLHEAAGVSVLEAAAAGLPVVGTRAGYVADWSPRRSIAIGADAHELAQAISKLQREPGRADAIASRAQKWSTANNVATMAAKVDALYRRTAGGL
ncbi:MAG TPA: glycosyltransferase family 4 protein [Vicinamibacterales bacterium]|nr:glycosyltransferase family 4 protein [Vicinamibacterales bacterium]